MKRVYIYCEGATEESFVNEILSPYFATNGISVIPIVCTTKRTESGKYKGGAVNYDKIKHELSILAKNHPHELITTMFDYYGMPDNTPEINCREQNLYARIERIEEAVNKDLGIFNCRFNLILHEFEGLLFSSPESFCLVADKKTVKKIDEIRDEFETPEHINNSVKTAPSKRIAELIPRYGKVRNGVILAKDMGIDKIKAQCKHFAKWINSILAWETTNKKR